MLTIEQNAYRVTKRCSDCPFNGKSSQRVDDIKKDLLKGGNFVCHKTTLGVDPKQEKKMCAGAYEYLTMMNRPNVLMTLAIGWGYEDVK